MGKGFNLLNGLKVEKEEYRVAGWKTRGFLLYNSV
jgi:hypothetical protein